MENKTIENKLECEHITRRECEDYRVQGRNILAGINICYDKDFMRYCSYKDMMEVENGKESNRNKTSKS